MRYLLVISITFCSLLLFAQTKGVTPVTANSQPATGQTYAVVVGISDYQDEGIPDLRFADKDAEAFAGFLQSPAGGSLDEDHLKVLLNEKATMAQFAIALDWLWEVVKEDDRVIIYFSGHGDVERKSLTQPGFLLCWDAPARVYLAGGTLALPMFQEVISTLSVQNKAKVIVITDACRSGKLSGSKVGGAQITGANLAKQYANEIKILSCQPDEFSIEGEQWGGGRGAFSYHLLDGLSGMADRNSDMGVNLKEIGRYLEDNVTEEVAPQSQNPMVIGNKTEKLTDVFPEILAQLKAGKKGQMQLFSATESRGTEEEVLAALSAGAEADSNIVELYFDFQKAIEEKKFLEPTNACADFYYEKLSQEPQLEKLHSSMRRNYAAALQDDAQQVMNVMLKTGLTEKVLKNIKYEDLYYNYPKYLERAGDLLSDQHYMYGILQARKHFFEGMIERKKTDKRKAFRKAFVWQPEMAHAMVQIIFNSDTAQIDSAQYYFEKATSITPSWVMPYIAMSYFYTKKLKQPKIGEEFLNIAGKVDSTSVYVWYEKGRFYRNQKKFEDAQKWYLKVIESTTGSNICFPCVHLELANLYKRNLRREKALVHYKKAIQLDSTFSRPYNSLGNLYRQLRQYEQAERYYKKAIELDTTRISSLYNLSTLYYFTNRLDETNKLLKKVLQTDSTFVPAYNVLGVIYSDAKKPNLAEKMYSKVIQIDSVYAPAHNNLGDIYKQSNRMEDAEKAYKKALHINDPFVNTYALNGLGDLYHKLKRLEEAEIKFKKAIEADSLYYKAYNNLGALYLKTGKNKEAELILRQSIQVNPKDGIANILTAQLALKNNDVESVWEQLETCLEKGYGDFENLQSEPDFEEMRKDPKWGQLMQKHFPDHYKTSNE